MKLSQLLYLLSFFAPIAFLLGYMAGAPRPVQQPLFLQKIDTRLLPASDLDIARHEASFVVDDRKWIQPNPR